MSEFRREQEPGYLGITTVAETVAHPEHPEENEDRYAIINLPHGAKAIILCDGMGGHEAGGVAAQTAVDSGREELQKNFVNSTREIKKTVLAALKASHEAVQETSKNENKKMGTTAVFGIFREAGSGHEAVLGLVGDTRTYHLSHVGEIQAISLDHNRFSKSHNQSEAICAQDFLDTIQDQGELTEEKFRNFFLNQGFTSEWVNQILTELQVNLAEYKAKNPDSAITNPIYYFFYSRNQISAALGLAARPPEPSVVTYHLAQDEMVLVCSDGVHDNLTRGEIETICKTYCNKPEHLTKALVVAAQARSQEGHVRSKPDDITAVVVEADKRPNIEQPVFGADLAPPVAPRRFIRGEKVRVERSNGTIEEGWEIIGFNNSTGDVKVRFETPRGTLTKEIPQEELTDLNPIFDESCFSRAQSFDSLFKMIKAIGAIVGSRKTYQATELIEIIERVKNGGADSSVVTNTFGIRQRVIELIQMEKIRKRF